MKQLSIFFSLSILLCLSFKPKPETSKDENRVMEIALFKVKKQAMGQFKALNDKMSQVLSSYGGYINSKTYQGTDRDSVFIDIVWWESLEKAKEAETKFKTDEQLKDYRDALGRVIYYDHIKPIDNGKLSFNPYTEESSSVEFGLFKIKDGFNDNYLTTRLSLMNVISKKYGDGLKEGIAYQSVDYPLIHVEFTYWSNMEVCTKAQHEINESEPTYKPFMQCFDDKAPEYFGFFKLIR